MPTAPLDDPEFLAELEKLDVVHVPQPARDVPHPTLEEWAQNQGIILPEPADEAARRPPQPLLIALKFVGLAFVGAGAAVLVFRDRVALILSTL